MIPVRYGPAEIEAIETVTFAVDLTDPHVTEMVIGLHMEAADRYILAGWGASSYANGW